MNDKLETSLLYDFYGELLQDSQKKVVELYVNDDLSLSESADLLGISRQGVHDMIRRCNSILSGYESKLRLVEKFLSMRTEVQKIRELALASHESEIARIAEAVLEEL